ncbi:hypothetical protein MZM54_03545 [[Brevibacterium] frigoritolerans]|nr:hypothetical protein [Peribacillus frigoritolerans]
MNKNEKETNIISICKDAIDDLEDSFKYKYLMPLMAEEMVRADTEFLIKKIKESAEADARKITEEDAAKLAEIIKEELWSLVKESYKNYEFPIEEKVEARTTISRRRREEKELENELKRSQRGKK